MSSQPILKSSRSQPVFQTCWTDYPSRYRRPLRWQPWSIHPLGKPEVPCLKSVLWKPLSVKTVLETALFQLWFQPVTKHIPLKWGTATAATARLPPPPPPTAAALPAQPFSSQPANHRNLRRLQWKMISHFHWRVNHPLRAHEACRQF